MTYHNLYAISSVVTPFVAMESVRVVIDRIFMRGLVVKAMGPIMRVNEHAQQASPIP